LLFRANRLLNRAKRKELNVSQAANEPTLPTVTGFAARSLLAVLRERNVALAPLLRRADLTILDLTDRKYRISAAAQCRLLELASEALKDDALGFHLAMQANPREAGLLFYVVSAAKTVGEGLALFERYLRIVNEAVRLKLMGVPNGVILQVGLVGLSRFHVRQNAEFGIAVILKAIREIVGRDICPIRVGFMQEHASNLREFKRFYRCPVEFRASSDYLELSAPTLALPLVTADQNLLETLKPICEAASRERGTRKGTLRASVENEVQAALPHGNIRKPIIAKALGISARTLSRRLADEGVTYAEVVDDLRRTLALQYLKDPSISLSQIAWLLGYEGSTSFNHAFGRWTGRSPSALRREGQARPGKSEVASYEHPAK
jgi:AraC-like DNA-binding protein